MQRGTSVIWQTRDPCHSGLGAVTIERMPLLLTTPHAASTPETPARADAASVVAGRCELLGRGRTGAPAAPEAG